MVYPNSNYTPRALEGNYVNDDILQEVAVAESTRVATAPLLMFENLFPKEVLSGTRTVKYFTQSVSSTEYNIDTDPQRRTPVPYDAHGSFPRIDVSGKEVNFKNINPYALRYDVSMDDRTLASNRADILQKIQNMGYAWAKHYNDLFIEDMTMTAGLSAAGTAGATDFGTGVSTDTYRNGDGTNCGYHSSHGYISITNAATSYWNLWEDTADPFQDIMDLKHVFNSQKGYPYQLTDVYLNDDLFVYLERYLQATDRKYAFNPMDPSTFNIGAIFGIDFHVVSNVGDFKDQNLLFGIDRNHPAGKTYTVADNFGTFNGTTNVHVWSEPDGRIVHNEFWGARGSIVREPKALAFVKVAA